MELSLVAGMRDMARSVCEITRLCRADRGLRPQWKRPLRDAESAEVLALQDNETKSRVGGGVADDQDVAAGNCVICRRGTASAANSDPVPV
jgi:hypothetical protein